jgi:hypothetical protein
MEERSVGLGRPGRETEAGGGAGYSDLIIEMDEMELEGEWPALWKPEPGRNGGVGGRRMGAAPADGFLSSASRCTGELSRWRSRTMLAGISSVALRWRLTWRLC